MNRRETDKQGWDRPARIGHVVAIGCVSLAVIGVVTTVGIYTYSQDNKDNLHRFAQEQRARDAAIEKLRRERNLQFCKEIVRNRSVSIALINAAFPPDSPPEIKASPVYRRFDILRASLLRPLKCPGINRRVIIKPVNFGPLEFAESPEASSPAPPLEFVPPERPKPRPRQPGLTPTPEHPPVKPRPRPEPPVPEPTPPAGDPGTVTPPPPPVIILPHTPAPPPDCKLIRLELLKLKICL